MTPTRIMFGLLFIALVTTGFLVAGIVRGAPPEELVPYSVVSLGLVVAAVLSRGGPHLRR